MYYLLFFMYFSKIQFLNGGYGATVTPSELRFYIGMSKATTYRYLKALMRSGYVMRVAHGEYTLCPNAGLQSLGFNALLPMDYFSQRSIVEEVILDELDVKLGEF